MPTRIESCKELAELQNRIKGADSGRNRRSYSGVRLASGHCRTGNDKRFDPKGQETCLRKKATASMLRELLAQLENGAAKLSSAMFNAPGNGDLQANGWSEGTTADAEAQTAANCMKSALKDRRYSRNKHTNNGDVLFEQQTRLLRSAGSFPGRHRTRRSRAPIESWRSNIILTRIRTTRAPRRSSRRRPKPTAS